MNFRGAIVCLSLFLQCFSVAKLYCWGPQSCNDCGVGAELRLSFDTHMPSSVFEKLYRDCVEVWSEVDGVQLEDREAIELFAKKMVDQLLAIYGGLECLTMYSNEQTPSDDMRYLAKIIGHIEQGYHEVVPAETVEVLAQKPAKITMRHRPLLVHHSEKVETSSEVNTLDEMACIRVLLNRLRGRIARHAN